MPDDDASRIRNEDLRRWRAQFQDATPIGSLPPRERAVAVGVVHKIRLVPGKGLEVTLEDGTGRLTASWSGRSNLPGLELGAGLRITGTVAEERDGGLRVRNPEYALVAEPYA
jgi:hypothetical protein